MSTVLAKKNYITNFTTLATLDGILQSDGLHGP